MMHLLTWRSIQYHVAQILLHRPFVAHHANDQAHSPQTNSADQWSICAASASQIVKYLKAFDIHYGLVNDSCLLKIIISTANVPPAFCRCGNGMPHLYCSRDSRHRRKFVKPTNSGPRTAKPGLLLQSTAGYVNCVVLEFSGASSATDAL